MLSIVATIEEFHSMLLGANIHIFTDHKNLTFDSLQNQRVLHLLNKDEEYSPMIHYIEGTNTILTDNFSRIQHLISSTQLANGKKLIDPVAVSDDEDADDAYFLDSELSGIIDNDINDALECFVNLLESYTPDQNLLSYDYIW